LHSIVDNSGKSVFETMIFLILVLFITMEGNWTPDSVASTNCWNRCILDCVDRYDFEGCEKDCIDTCSNQNPP